MRLDISYGKSRSKRIKVLSSSFNNNKQHRFRLLIVLPSAVWQDYKMTMRCTESMSRASGLLFLGFNQDQGLHFTQPIDILLEHRWAYFIELQSTFIVIKKNVCANVMSWAFEEVLSCPTVAHSCAFSFICVGVKL